MGASLEVMERDARLMRKNLPFVFTNLKDGTGLQEIIAWLEQHLQSPQEQRRSVIDSHAPYAGQPHSHDSDHTHSHQH